MIGLTEDWFAGVSLMELAESELLSQVMRIVGPRSKMTNQIKVVLLALSAFSLAAVLQGAAEPDIKLVKAPSLHSLQTGRRIDLGLWDDAFIPEGQDFIFLRRGEEIFSLSMFSPPELKKLRRVPQARTATIVAGTHLDGKLWLFLQSNETAPFAVEVYSGKIARFDLPGVKIPGEHAPEIQSHLIIPHARGAIVMVAGGDRKSWPRDGNRPIYFWMSLKSGKVVQFPAGWDLEYFTSDQTIAVFEKQQEEAFQRRPLQAIDVRSGGTIDKVPKRGEQLSIPFSWTETQSVKPLYLRRPETGDRDYFAGISFNGLAYPFQINLKGVSYLSTAKANDGFAGFRLRAEGVATGAPGPFWISQLSGSAQPEHVQDGVVAFEMLRQGRCVFVAYGHGQKGRSSEAFVYDHSTRTAWNPLDGVVRLPPLDPDLADRDYVEDSMAVQLIGGFGSRAHDPIALCLFSHFRGDMRAYVIPPDGKYLETVTWRRAVILTGSGERYMTDLFHDETVPDQIWLHNSGRMMTGHYTWQGSGARRERKVQLSEIVLSAPRKQNE